MSPLVNFRAVKQNFQSKPIFIANTSRAFQFANKIQKWEKLLLKTSATFLLKKKYENLTFLFEIKRVVHILKNKLVSNFGEI